MTDRVIDLNLYKKAEELKPTDNIYQCPCEGVEFHVRDDWHMFCAECGKLAIVMEIDEKQELVFNKDDGADE